MIIDVHSHLGDILYENGGALIWKTEVKKEFILDLVTLSEWGLHNTIAGFEDFFYKRFGSMVTRAERARNATATLENMRKSMDESGVTKTVCMPIPPYVTFDDLAAAAARDNGVIPFTGIDFSKSDLIEKSLARDVANGARGLKLHPVIQKEPINSPRTLQAVEEFAQYKLPVLFHCGVSEYYLGTEKTTRQNPSNGEIKHTVDLVAAFPNVDFIAGHAGLFQVRDVMSLLGGYKNVYVDISFQSPGTIRELVDVFGPEKVLFASDWPYGNRPTAVKAVRKACQGDRILEDLIYYQNAARLLNME